MFQEDKDKIEYLKQYEKLCKKYDVQISACGCCESPFLNTTIAGYEINNIDYKNNKLIFDIIKSNEKGYMTYASKNIKDLEKMCKEYYEEKEN